MLCSLPEKEKCWGFSCFHKNYKLQNDSLLVGLEKTFKAKCVTNEAPSLLPAA